MTYSSILMCWSLNAPRCTISQIKWYLISMCLERLWNTGFSKRRIPLWLSQKITVVFSTCSNSSLNSFLNQTASQQAILVVMYSVSTVLRATNFCFLIIQEIEADPNEKCCRTECLGTATTTQIRGCHIDPQSLCLSCLPIAD